MSLYNNKKQEEYFYLHEPHQADSMDCRIMAAFKDFKCSESYVLAERTTEYNCIGWAIAVKDFIDPAKHINKYYNSKQKINDLVTTDEKKVVGHLYRYEPNILDCQNSIKKFFDEYKELSVLPNKENYIAVGSIPNTPKDGSIAFYFISGDEDFIEDRISHKGFSHAARYVEEVHSWVSDVWTSKFGQYKLMTHEKFELMGDVYGSILCYLTPKGQSFAYEL